MASAAWTTSTTSIWCSSTEARRSSQKQSKHQVCTDRQGPALGSGAWTEQTWFSLQLTPGGLYTEFNMVLAFYPTESQSESDRGKEQFFRLNSVRTAVIANLAFQHQANTSLNNFHWVKTTGLMPYLQDNIVFPINWLGMAVSLPDFLSRRVTHPIIILDPATIVSLTFPVLQYINCIPHFHSQRGC